MLLVFPPSQSPEVIPWAAKLWVRTLGLTLRLTRWQLKEYLNHD